MSSQQTPSTSTSNPYKGRNNRHHPTWHLHLPNNTTTTIAITHKTQHHVSLALLHNQPLYKRFKTQYAPIPNTTTATTTISNDTEDLDFDLPLPPFDTALHHDVLSYLISIRNQYEAHAQVSLCLLMADVGVSMGFRIPYLWDEEGRSYQGIDLEGTAGMIARWIAARERRETAEAEAEIVEGVEGLTVAEGTVEGTTEEIEENAEEGTVENTGAN